MDVSIIIINYRSPQLIINCLTSIYKFTNSINFEIIVVDNDPENGEGQLVRAQFPQIRWVDMEYNSGFGRANNKAMSMASGRYFLILNADTLVFDNVIEKCITYMDAQPAIIASGAMQCYPDGTQMPFYKSFNEFRKTLFILPTANIFTKILDKIYPLPVYNDARQCDWLVGAFIFVRKEGFISTGGFDDDFFMYAEDVEWSGRLGKLGKLCYFEDCRFIHLENDNPFRRTNISWINRFSTQMQVSNMLWIRKQYGFISYLVFIIHYISMIPVILVWKMAINLLKTGNPFKELKTQSIFTQKTLILLRYFWRTATLKPYLYKIHPSENIDLLTKS